MSEYRHDLLTGHWVILAESRGERPDDFGEGRWERQRSRCPFCAGREEDTPPEVSRYTLDGGPGWQVRVVPNKYPAVTPSHASVAGQAATHAARGHGVHEVVIESPVHIGSLTELPTAAAALAFRAYADRLAALRSRGDLAYGLVFKNVGAAAGASLEHAHSQVIATALLPPALGTRTARWREEYRERQRTVLQRWRDDELRDGRRVIATTDHFAAICPFASRTPYEMRVVPLQHRPLFEHSDSQELLELAGLVQRIVSQLERVVERPSYNLILHTAPFDTAPHDYYDWHIEILPRLARVAGFEWGTGCFINSLAPEDAAERLRAT